MDPKKLLTLNYPKNVGTGDRVFRLLGGLALVAAAALLPVPLWAAGALGVSGVMSAATGVASRCSIYYLMGHSTCPVAARGE